jgi:hypothetical protein
MWSSLYAPYIVIRSIRLGITEFLSLMSCHLTGKSLIVLENYVFVLVSRSYARRWISITVGGPSDLDAVSFRFRVRGDPPPRRGTIASWF